MTFVSLQALRGMAALGVMLFHLLPFEARYLPGLTIAPAGFSAGRAGVDLFFVLSGFLAIWTTRRSSDAGLARRFLLRRISRIYPTYWLYCIPLLLSLFATRGSVFGNGEPDVIASLLLVPNPDPPLLLVAWTLEFEVYFYLVSALLIWARLGRRERILALAAWGSIVTVLHTVVAPTRQQALLDAVLSPLVIEFLAGCAGAYVCTIGLSRLAMGAVGVMGLVVFITALIWSETLFAMPLLRVSVFGIGGALLLIGCFGEDATIRRVLPHVFIRIGDSSYSLYLSHLFTISIVGHVLSRLRPMVELLAAPIGHVIVLCATVVVALMVAEASYRWVEMPLLRLTRHLVTPRSVPQTAPAA